jgi:tripartite-type tricarboxylate transporter receptor subunit TctC
VKVKHLLFVFLFTWVYGTLGARDAVSQRYPDRPIQLVIPNVAGSSMDNSARALAEELEKVLGTKVVSLNKPGASTVLGTDFVVRGKKDGYTLLYAGASSLVMAPATNPEVVHYDPAKDLEPLGFHYFLPNTVNTRTDFPWRNFPEFIDYAKKNPEKLRVATSGVGHPTHFMLEMIQVMTGARFVHVPFQGGAPVVTSVLGGHVEVCCDTFANVKQHVDAGKMQILLTTYKLPAFPDVPTITELGYKESLPVGWMGLWAPAGIPEEARRVLIPATEKAVRNSKPKIDLMWAVCEYKTPLEQTRLREEQYRQISETAAKMGLRKKEN